MAKIMSPTTRSHDNVELSLRSRKLKRSAALKIPVMSKTLIYKAAPANVRTRTIKRFVNKETGSERFVKVVPPTGRKIHSTTSWKRFMLRSNLMFKLRNAKCVHRNVPELKPLALTC